MSAQGFRKCYFLAPTRNNPPEGPVKLGNVLSSPSEPDEPMGNPIALDQATVRPHNEYNWTYTYGQDVTNGFGIWASFLQLFISAGGDAAVQWAKENGHTMSCTKITTLEFTPTKEYVKKSVEDQEVKDYLKNTRFWATNTKIYMVTGIKIASGASMVASMAKRWGLNLHAGVDLTSLGAPVQPGAGVKHESGSTEGESFSKADDFVIGYRLRRIKVSKKGEITENKQYNDGAAFGKDKESVEKEMDFEVDGLEEEDAQDAEFGLHGRPIVDETDLQECICVDTT